ncbi:alpha-N-acetylglucosaminidase [Streptomyces sp. NPDC049954]|uniref:alpha-N-acetylglucosaminidase n=1 Tax=Streptomyces sp. NPDC049954 TaxID=3155779 RepID=UPI003439444C
MSWGRRTFLGALAGTTGAVVACSPAAAGDGGPAAGRPATGEARGRSAATGAAHAAVRRLLPGHADQLAFEDLARAADGGDRFRVSGREGAITVAGTTPAAQLTGVRHYLKHVAHATIGWAGSQTDLPRLLPAPGRPGPEGRADVPHRFVLNDTSDGYTGPYHDWSYWEREIDVLALHGFNEVLVYAGADAVYHRLFQEFGYGEEELRSWIPGPAHQPWWLLQNLAAFPAPLSRQLLDQRAALGRRIVGRLRELGMTPVLPGYFGTVPPGFADRNPGARTVPQGTWMGFDRPDWLDPRTDGFAQVAAAFYRVQAEVFGVSTLYKMDLLHEGGKAGDVPVEEATRGVQRALLAARPDALWVILGWQKNPPKAVIDAADRSKMLVVDGLSDRFPEVTDRESDWRGTPYAFGSIWNFGGHTALGANTPEWVSTYGRWRDRPGSALRGTALMPEAADNNPAAFELFSELPWTEGEIDLADWFRQYARSRYGASDPHAEAAWDVLRRTAYGTTREDRWSEPADGLFGARPALNAVSAGKWSPKALRYPPESFEPALGELLAVRAGLRGSSAYRRDLLDVARQALANRSRVLLPKLNTAYGDGDSAEFARLTRRWLGLVDLLERLVATDADHLLGRWVEQARVWGADGAEKDRLQYDALSLLTTWGTREGADAGLRDYANREWSGLVGGLYRLRWSTYFQELARALEEGREPAAVDWFALEDRWTRAPGRLHVEPQGDTYLVAGEVRDALARKD